MIAKPDNPRVQVLIRMRPEDKHRIREAARAESLSVSAYMTRAALAMIQAPSTPALPSNASDAIAALVALGHSQIEAQRMVRAALSHNPAGTPEELIEAAYRREQ